MSFLVETETINGIKSQKDIILEKIHRIKSFNNNIKKENIALNSNIANNINEISPFYSQDKKSEYNSNQNSTNKKVFIKPVVKNKNNIIIKQKYLTNNCINKYLNFTDIKKLDKNNNNINVDFINNNIFNLQNKIIVNNDSLITETSSDYDIEKISKFHNNINNNEIKEKYFTLNNEKRNNNLINIRGKNMNHNRKKTAELNHIFLKKNNNIMDKVKYKKGKEHLNLNSINSLSNNNINKLNTPLYLRQLFSLSNTFNENDTLNNIYSNTEINNESLTVKATKSKKKIKKNILFKNKNREIDTLKDNATQEELQSKSNYYINTEGNPNTKIEEIEITGIRTHKNSNSINTDSISSKSKTKKLNFLETKRKNLKAIETEKQKLIDESYKNYQKYLSLIQKQQQEYKEYDEYLKNEINNNQNSQMKLQISQNNLNVKNTYSSSNSSYFNLLKNKNKKFIYSRLNDDQLYENKTMSSKNFCAQKKIMQKFVFPEKKLSDKKEYLTNNDVDVDGDEYAYRYRNESLLNEANETTNFNYTFKNNNYFENKFKPNHKKVLKINIEDIKRLEKDNIKIKYQKSSTGVNFINTNKIKTSMMNKNINFSNNNINFNSYDAKTIKSKKTKKKIKADIFQTVNCFKNNNEILTSNNSKNKLSLNNVKKRLILKKLMKNIQQEKELIHSKQKYKNSNSNIKSCHSKGNSIKKNEEFNIYKETLSSCILTHNNYDIHRMISEEKKRILNKFSNNNMSKFQGNRNNNSNNEYYSQVEINNNNTLNNDKNSNFYKIKNGLYYSAFESNINEDI